MANAELLDKVLDHIKNNPQTWRQSVWYAVLDNDGNQIFYDFQVDVQEVNSCNTAFCFAGHAAMMTGFPAPPKTSGNIWDAVIDGNHYHVNEWAQKELDLSWGQSDALFSAENTLEDLETMVNLLKEDPTVDEDTLLRAVDRYEEYDEDEDCPCCREDDDDNDDTW